MSRVYCPYCGMSYDIDKSLIPEDDVKVRCRSCANVFILDKETGAIKNNESKREHEIESASQAEKRLEAEEKPAKNEDDESKDSAQSMLGDTSDSQTPQESEEKDNTGKKKMNIMQIVTLMLLILILILAIISALDYYKIINLPIISKWLSQFRFR